MIQMEALIEKPKTKEIDGQFLTAEEIIKKYKTLVHSIANRYRKCINAVIDYDDIMSAGNLGLWKAYEGFDQSKGFKFMTYAHIKVRGEIQRMLRDFNPGLNYPRSIKIWSMKTDSENKEEIAEQLGIPLEKAVMVVDYKRNCYPAWLESPVGDDENLRIADILPQYDNFNQMYINELLTSLKRKDERLYHVALLFLQDKPQRVIGEKVGRTQVQVGRYIKEVERLCEVF